MSLQTQRFGDFVEIEQPENLKLAYAFMEHSTLLVKAERVKVKDSQVYWKHGNRLSAMYIRKNLGQRSHGYLFAAIAISKIPYVITAQNRPHTTSQTGQPKGVKAQPGDSQPGDRVAGLAKESCRCIREFFGNHGRLLETEALVKYLGARASAARSKKRKAGAAAAAPAAGGSSDSEGDSDESESSDDEF